MSRLLPEQHARPPRFGVASCRDRNSSVESTICGVLCPVGTHTRGIGKMFESLLRILDRFWCVRRWAALTAPQPVQDKTPRKVERLKQEIDAPQKQIDHYRSRSRTRRRSSAPHLQTDIKKRRQHQEAQVVKAKEMQSWRWRMSGGWVMLPDGVTRIVGIREREVGLHRHRRRQR